MERRAVRYWGRSELRHELVSQLYRQHLPGPVGRLCRYSAAAYLPVLHADFSGGPNELPHWAAHPEFGLRGRIYGFGVLQELYIYRFRFDPRGRVSECVRRGRLSAHDMGNETEILADRTKPI